ncbi:MAG: hypothetical protein AAF675_18780 [Pseudomonadota bacterium]
MTERLEEDGVEAEVLGEDAPGPRPGARTIRAPGWVGRNRSLIENGQEMARMAVPFLPPPARLGVVAASLAVEGLLTVEDARTGRVRGGDAGLRGVGIALDALGLAAAARLAPAPILRHAGRIAAVRAVFARIEMERRPLA